MESVTISGAILELIEWVNGENLTEVEKGIVIGLKMAQTLAETVERSADNGK